MAFNFAKYVSLQTALCAGFNETNRSMYLVKEEPTRVQYLPVYLGKVEGTEIAVVAREYNTPGRKPRWEAYFGTFPAKPDDEPETVADANMRHNRLFDIASRKHRVRGRDLELLIRKAVHEAETRHA